LITIAYSVFWQTLDNFYEEFKRAVSVNNNASLNEASSDIIDEAYILNYELLKKYKHTADYSKTLTVNYNFLESFENLRKGQWTTLNKKKIFIKIISSNCLNKNIQFSFKNWLLEILQNGFIYKVQTN